MAATRKKTARKAVYKPLSEQVYENRVAELRKQIETFSPEASLNEVRSFAFCLSKNADLKDQDAVNLLGSFFHRIRLTVKSYILAA